MENNTHASNSSNLKLNSISFANDCQKAKLVELLGAASVLARVHLREDVQIKFTVHAIARPEWLYNGVTEDQYLKAWETIWDALHSAGALVQGGGAETLLDYGSLAAHMACVLGSLEGYGHKETAAYHSAKRVQDELMRAYTQTTSINGDNHEQR